MMKILLILFIPSVISLCPKEIPSPLGKQFINPCNSSDPDGSPDPNTNSEHYGGKKQSFCGYVSIGISVKDEYSILCACIPIYYIDYFYHDFRSKRYWGCIYSSNICPNKNTVTEEELCGIQGYDFRDKKFIGNHPIFGKGCTLLSKDGSKYKNNCLCKPVIGKDKFGSVWNVPNVYLTDWRWQSQ